MKNRILLLVFTLITFNSFSQKLSFSEVLKLREMSIGQVEEYLTSRGWGLTEEIEESQYSRAMNVFSFGDESFISYYFSTEGVGLISVGFYKREEYSQYLAEIKKIGCDMVDSRMEDGDIVKYYSNASLYFKIITSTTENSFGEKSTFFSILIDE